MHDTVGITLDQNRWERAKQRRNPVEDGIEQHDIWVEYGGGCIRTFKQDVREIED